MLIRNRVKGADQEPHRYSNEIKGSLLFLFGVLLFLALISYSPSDLPRWGMFEVFASAKKSTGNNILGHLGGYLAFCHFLVFGAASFGFSLIIMWLGFMLLMFDHRITWKKAVGLFGVIISAAIFFHMAGWFKEWARYCHMTGAGGVIGSWLCENAVQSWFGVWGGIVISALSYLIFNMWLLGAGIRRSVYQGMMTYQNQMRRLKKKRLDLIEIQRQESLLRAEREKRNKDRLVQPIDSNKKESPIHQAQENESISASSPSTEQPKKNEPVKAASIPTPISTPDSRPQIIDSSTQRKSMPVPAPGEKPFERESKKSQDGFLSTSAFADYELPGFDLLNPPEPNVEQTNVEELIENQRLIIDTLKSFRIQVTAGDITRGPTITRYEVYPAKGLSVKNIVKYESDLALATRAERINILAPIPGKDSVGIEIANDKKMPVPLHELLVDPEFRSAKKKIPLALGKDVYGNTVIGDLAAMPHLLVAGATGSGKSVCINSIIASILYKFGPDELRFIMVDPKVVEMQMYNQLPHMVVPVVTDPKKTVAALKWVVNEMEKRYRIFAKEKVRNFDSFNHRPKPELAEIVPPIPEPEVDLDEIDAIARSLEEGDLAPERDDALEFALDEPIPDRFPYIVVIIDELADLMQTASADVEMCIARIAQKARAAGIHLIVATQTPRADVVTGIIKANIPCRIAFQVSSQLDSRVILDHKGAEKLVGKGDMLYLPPGSAKLERSQGAFVTDDEVERIIEHCASQGAPCFETDIHASLDQDEDEADEEISSADEEMLVKCLEVVRQEQKASTSLLQRRLRLGYTRAARMMDLLELRGYIGPGDGAKAREVYVR